MKFTQKLRAELVRECKRIRGVKPRGFLSINVLCPHGYMNLLSCSQTQRLAGRLGDIPGGSLASFDIHSSHYPVIPDGPAKYAGMVLLRLDTRKSGYFEMEVYALISRRGRLLHATDAYGEMRSVVDSQAHIRRAIDFWRKKAGMPIENTRNPVPLPILADWIEEYEPDNDLLALARVADLNLIRTALSAGFAEYE